MMWIKILIADDSPFMRNSLRRLFETGAPVHEPGVKVVGEAASGKEVMAFLKAHTPVDPVDVVLLDMNMPEMDGLETTRAIMSTCPTPILLLTAADKTDPRVIQALTLGAVEMIQKPGGDERSPHLRESRLEIMEKVTLVARANTRMWSRRALLPAQREQARLEQAQPVMAQTPHSRMAESRTHACGAVSDGPHKKYDLILIGASTGGPAALGEILSALPHDFGIPVLIVQHIMEGYSESLAEILQTKCALPVREASTLVALEPGCVTIGKTGYHLEVTASKNIRLTRRTGAPGTVAPGTHARGTAAAGTHACGTAAAGELNGFFMPSVDVLFESAAKNFDGAILGVVLTGMGNDGLQGCRALKAKGHTVIIQDKRSSVVWGMPGEVYKDGCYDRVLSLAEIAETLRRMKS